MGLYILYIIYIYGKRSILILHSPILRTGCMCMCMSVCVCVFDLKNPILLFIELIDKLLAVSGRVKQKQEKKGVNRQEKC